MSLDTVSIWSNALTMLYDQSKPELTCQLSLSHDNKCGPYLRVVSKRVILEKIKDVVGDLIVYCRERGRAHMLIHAYFGHYNMVNGL